MAEATLLALSGPSALLAAPQNFVLFARTFWTALTLLAALVALAPAEAAAPAKKGPAWAELTADQQQVLEPLKPEWDKMDRQPRVKWVGIAKRYPAMTEKEQRRIQSRMQRWAKLTPEQREVARNSYRKNVGALPPDKKKELQAQWEEYRALPEHEKRSLAAKAAEQKPTVSPRRPPKKSAGQDRGAAPLAPNTGR